MMSHSDPSRSIWSATQVMPAFPPLDGDRDTDVLIIGGGLAGLLCALLLRREGVDCMLLEADRICAGVTQNTTAKVTSQHGLIYHTLLQRFGPEQAKLYYQANQDALDRYRALVRDIACDWEEKDNCVYSLDDPQVLDQEMAALDRLGIPAQLVKCLPLPFSVAGAVRFPAQAQFHPLKFAAAVAPGLPIFEGSPVRELAPHLALTPQGRVRAQRIIVATHFPLLNKHGSYFLKLYQHRSYVLALENAPQVDGMYVDQSGSGLSFRNYRNLLLLGGGGHRTGKQGSGWESLERFAKKHWPKSTVTARWATQDCMTLDGMPYIGLYSARTSGLYVATGFNKWGMTSSMVAAALLTDLIQGRENPYAALLSPSRSILRPQLAANAGKAIVNLLTPTVPRCPHMGCALKWNAVEHSWDCPCHGSRFAQTGELLDNPSAGNLHTH